MDEEDLIFWQDILDEVAAGRIAGHTCPFCREAQIEVEQGDRGHMRLSCPKCRKYIEGTIGSQEQI